jgi:hypothetical protein
MATGGRKDLLLTLDEPDSTIHPSLVARMFKVIQDVLVCRLGARVVITTHSPTTVAVAPEAAEFWRVDCRADPFLEPIDRRRAGALLTVGLPLISVVRNEKMLVLVEGPNDQIVLDEMSSGLTASGTLSPTVAPVFFPVGGEGARQVGGGRAAVERWTRTLADIDAPVKGLIDSDGGRPACTRNVEVLPQWDSMECLCVNPRLLAAYIYGPACGKRTDAARTGTPKVFSELSNQDTQAVMDSLVEKLGVPRGPQVNVTYNDGRDLLVPTAILQGKGHDLIRTAIQALPELTRFCQNGRVNEREFVQRVAADTYRSYPQVVPKAVVGWLKGILELSIQ